MIVADEPVSSLDASVRGEILALLLSLRDRLGLSVLVVTHDLGLAWNIADRLAVMYLGRIVESRARPRRSWPHPRHPYTAALLSVLPETGHRAPVVLAGEPPDPARIPRGLPVPPALPGARRRHGGSGAGIEQRCRGEAAARARRAAGRTQAACLPCRATRAGPTEPRRAGDGEHAVPAATVSTTVVDG